MNKTYDDRFWMREALHQAHLALPLDVPVGAVLVKDNALLANGYNRRESDKTPLGHAELMAMDAGAKALGDWRLTGCTLYVTLEPCPMCASAITQARIERLVYGASDPLAGACGSKYHLLGNHPSSSKTSPTLLAGILEEECQSKLKTFFQAKR